MKKFKAALRHNDKKQQEMSIQNVVDNQLARLGLISQITDETMKRYCLDTFAPAGSVIPAIVFNAYVEKKIEEGYKFHPNYGLMVKDNPDGSRNIVPLRPLDPHSHSSSQKITVLGGGGLFLVGDEGNLDFDAFIQNTNCTSYRLKQGDTLHIPSNTIHTFKPGNCQGLETKITYSEGRYNPDSRVCLQKYHEYWKLEKYHEYWKLEN